jgi:ubiquinone/menaquinone biosynthesis C-methylase UbiE
MQRLLEATARAEREHFWFRGFRRFVEPFVREAAAGLPRARILDCGSGTGVNLPLLARYGTPVGIDLTWAGLAFAQARGERRLAQASAARLPFADATFDIVASFDVITALPDDEEAAALGEMCRVLRPGGHLVVNVAAMGLLKGNHSLLAREVRRYTRRTLTERLDRSGFHIVRMTYTNATIAPLIAAVRTLQRVAGHEASHQEIAVPAAPLNAALTGVLALEAAALRVVNMPFGSSLLALARKRGHSPFSPHPHAVHSHGQAPPIGRSVALGRHERLIAGDDDPPAGCRQRRCRQHDRAVEVGVRTEISDRSVAGAYAYQWGGSVIAEG